MEPARLELVHVTRRPVHEHGGVERVVRGLAAAMTEARPSWRIGVISAFRRCGGLESTPALSDVLAAIAIAGRLLRYRGDVAFVHCPECLWLALPLLRLRRDRPRVVAVWHGAGPRRALVLRPSGHPLARALAWLMCAEERPALAADAHVIIHPHIAQDLRLSYGFTGRVRVVRNALDPDCRTTPGQDGRRAGASPPVAIWVGQTDHGKGLDVALAALRIARRTVPELRLRVVGLPPDESRREDGVEWTGVVAPEAVAAAYRRSDLLLFPTRYESFGLVVLEAMAAGLPVIVSDAIPEGIVTDGRNGCVVSGHDAPDYAAALVRLCADADHRARVGAVNVADAGRFDQATTAAGYPSRHALLRGLSVQPRARCRSFLRPPCRPPRMDLAGAPRREGGVDPRVPNPGSGPLPRWADPGRLRAVLHTQRPGRERSRGDPATRPSEMTGRATGPSLAAPHLSACVQIVAEEVVASGVKPSRGVGRRPRDRGPGAGADAAHPAGRAAAVNVDAGRRADGAPRAGSAPSSSPAGDSDHSPSTSGKSNSVTSVGSWWNATTREMPVAVACGCREPGHLMRRARIRG